MKTFINETIFNTGRHAASVMDIPGMDFPGRRHGKRHGGRHGMGPHHGLRADRRDGDGVPGECGERGERGGRHERGGGRGEHGHGSRGERGTRVLGRGELPLVVLALLADAPRHGYEIIRLIEERCRGAYTPSAGVIYPTLTLLEEQEYTTTDPASVSGKRRYLITDAGRQVVSVNEGLIRGAFSRMDMVGRMRAREALPARVAQAMETLKQALLAPGTQWQDSEAERIAQILEAAAHAIIDRPAVDTANNTAGATQ